MNAWLKFVNVRSTAGSNKIQIKLKLQQISMYNSTQYGEDIEEKDRAQMSRDCTNKQWNKEEVCFMTVALNKFSLMGKEIEQPHLPMNMR